MSPLSPQVAGAIAANLRTRARLGLAQVQGQAKDLGRLDALFSSAQDTPGDLTLDQVRENLGECTRFPLHQGRQHIVFGTGPDNARLVLIGEAPGAQEDRQGEPFVGPAGQLLNRMLLAVGLRRQEVYITNIIKCRPPGNRDPQPGEIGACRPFLEAQVRALAPKVICTLGRPAAQSILATKAPISALRGVWAEMDGVPLLPTFHPAYLLRSPGAKAQAYADLKALARKLA